LYLFDILNYSKNLKGGNDERPLDLDKEKTLHNNIILNHEKMILLKYLENENISQINKLNKIYNNSHFLDTPNNIIRVPNISKGLLYDW